MTYINKEVSIFIYSIWSCYKLMFDLLSVVLSFLLCSSKLSQMLRCCQDFHRGPGELKLFRGLTGAWASVAVSPRWSCILFPRWINISLSWVQTSLTQHCEPFLPGKCEHSMTIYELGKVFAVPKFLMVSSTWCKVKVIAAHWYFNG